MKSANRKSLLPQPNARPLEFPTRTSSATAVIQEAPLTRKQSGSISQAERPQSRPGVNTSGIARPTSRHALEDRKNSVESIRPTSSSSNALRRLPSTRTAPTHAKSTSNGSLENGSSSHRPTASRELKAPSTSRLARSGTLTRTTSSAAEARSHARAGSIASLSPVKSALHKPAGPVPTRGASIAVREETGLSDTSKLQIELLQLSIMHEEACQALSVYEASARKKLSERHSNLQQMLGEVVVLEKQRTKEANLEALSLWLEDPSQLTDKLAIVSSIYDDTLALTKDGSDFSNLMLEFQDWILAAEDSWENDTAHGFGQLPEQWTHTHASIALSIRALQRELSGLPTPGSSSLAAIMKGCAGVLDTTLRELDMMAKLEKMLLDLDRTRIEETIAASGCRFELLTLPEDVPLSWQDV